MDALSNTHNYIPAEIVDSKVAEADAKIAVLEETLQKASDALETFKAQNAQTEGAKTFSWKARLGGGYEGLLRKQELEKKYEAVKADVTSKINAIQDDVKHYRGMKEQREILESLEAHMMALEAKLHEQSVALARKAKGLFVLGPNYYF